MRYTALVDRLNHLSATRMQTVLLVAGADEKNREVCCTEG